MVVIIAFMATDRRFRITFVKTDCISCFFMYKRSFVGLFLSGMCRFSVAPIQVRLMTRMAVAAKNQREVLLVSSLQRVLVVRKVEKNLPGTPSFGVPCPEGLDAGVSLLPALPPDGGRSAWLL